MRMRKPEGGTKPEKIFFHVRQKEAEALKRKIPKIVKQKGIDKLEAKMQKAKREADQAEKRFLEACKKVGITRVKRYLRNNNTYRKEWAVLGDAHIVPDRIVKKLQNAQALFDVGKHKEFKQVCDEVIKEYKIGGI
jgi:hypothetical protein